MLGCVGMCGGVWGDVGECVLYMYLVTCSSTLYAQRTLVTFTFHGTGVEELTSMEKCMEQAQSQGCWLLLHNIHTSPPLLAQLVTMMEHHPDRGGDWRLWLSSHADHTLPTALLHRVTKVSTDSPKVSGALPQPNGMLGSSLC